MTAFTPFRKEDLEQSIPARFEARTDRTPGRLAVKAGRREVAYAELNAFANRIARAILEEGGEREETVALLFEEPGIDAAAAMLGALKAGRIYVPLDPSEPSGRLGPMLEDSRARLVLSGAESFAAARRWETPGRRVLSVREIEKGIAAENPGLALSPDRLAYVYYTSGSTGNPKGVADTHRNVLHNVLRYTNSLRIGEADRLTWLQRPSFSGSVSNVFCAVLNGGAVFPFDVRKRGLGALAPFVREERITVYHSAPSVFRHAFRSAAPCPDVRVVRLEGDRADWKDVEIFRERFGPGCRLVNGLGATETGISRQYFVGRETPVSGPVLPVGWATEDVECAIADESGGEAPAGEVGEILVRSRYLAAGYWNRPDRTESAFAPDPKREGWRIYRSGDLGRMRPDGCLEHLGRRNFDAKVRGRRVEVEAVEAALREIPGIREALADVREDENGDGRLVAWLVATEEAMPAPGALRRSLAGALPDHAVPSAFVRLDALPLDANGKVDRRSLPGPGPDRPRVETGLVHPSTPMEELVAAVWREVLSLSPVGIHDNFFELGGDSLKALRVANRLTSLLESDVPVVLLFRNPTIAALSSTLPPVR